MSTLDPIQVFPNEYPILPSRRIPSFIAYRDPESDRGLYGFGDTHAEAITDYLRNCAESICSNCDNADRDCILFEPNLSAYYKLHIPQGL